MKQDEMCGTCSNPADGGRCRQNGEPEGLRSVCRHRNKWKGNVKVDSKEACRVVMYLIHT